MTETVVSMDVRHPTETVAVIDINGEVTASCETVLARAYEEASTPATKLIVLNFSGLEYMNSSGIGMLVTMLVRANRQHQKLAAYGLTDHYRQIFELTRLDEAISIHDDEAGALSGA
jgi:anti-anti-sigma factor